MVFGVIGSIIAAVAIAWLGVGGADTPKTEPKKEAAIDAKTPPDYPAGRFPPHNTPLVRVLRDIEFDRDLGDFFVSNNNRARTGQAIIGNIHPDSEPPNYLFLGHRKGQSCVLRSGSGNFQMTWAPAVQGRFILLFARPQPYGNDSWGIARVEINRAVRRVAEYRSCCPVAFIDLGSPTDIRQVIIRITNAQQQPGLTGVEIH